MRADMATARGTSSADVGGRRHRRPGGSVPLGCRTESLHATRTRLWRVATGGRSLPPKELRAAACNSPTGCCACWPPCFARGAALSATPTRERESVLGLASSAALERRSLQASRSDDPTASGCRAAPRCYFLNVGAEGPCVKPGCTVSIGHSAGHHAIANRRAARTRRQGPKAARAARGRSQGKAAAKRLDDAEHSSIIDRVMAVADIARGGPARARRPAFPHSTIGCAIACGTGGRSTGRTASPADGDATAVSAVRAATTRTPTASGVSDPRGGPRTIHAAITGVAHAMVSPPLTFIHSLAGGEERRRKTSGRHAVIPTTVLPARRLRGDGVRLSGIQRPRTSGEEMSAKGTTSFSEVVPQVVSTGSPQATPTREERWRY